jgi:hypothetical protein
VGTAIAIGIRLARLALLFLPFFISLIFGGRPVREVLKANLSFTIVFSLLLTISSVLLVTTITLAQMRRDYAVLKEQHQELQVDIQAVRLQNQRLVERIGRCVSNDYDPNRVLDRLNIYLGD